MSSPLAHWRTSRRATDADALPVATLAAPRGKGPFHRFWLGLAAEADEAEVGWLAQTLFTQLPESASPHDPRSPAWLQRLNAIRRYAPDPRISAAVTEVLLSAPFTSASADPFEPYGAVSDLVTADVRQARVLEAWLRSPRGRSATTRRAILVVAHQWIQECRRLGTEDRVPPTISTPGVAPIDAASRAVWADALIEANNPRGEFIALHRAGKTVAARKLLKQYAEPWFGELNRVLSGAEYEGGFLVRASLNHSSAAEDSVWKRAVNHPELRSLERLHRGRGNATRYDAFVHACPWLKLVELHGPQTLELLLEQPSRPVETLFLFGPMNVARLADASIFPALRTVQFEGWFSTDPALRSALPLIRRLDSVRLSTRGTHFAPEIVVPAIRALVSETRTVEVEDWRFRRTDGRIEITGPSLDDRRIRAIAEALQK